MNAVGREFTGGTMFSLATDKLGEFGIAGITTAGLETETVVLLRILASVAIPAVPAR
jgi:hypothetical protein